MRRATFLLLLLIGSAAAAEPARWTLRAKGLGTDYEKRSVAGFLSGYSELVLDRGSGFEIAAELRPRPRLGLELSAGRLSLNGRTRSVQYVPISFNPTVIGERVLFSGEGDLVVQPIALALLIHPFGNRNRPLDFYAGPQIAWVSYKVDVPGLGDRDPEPALGAKLGAEMPLGRSPWSLGLELRYLEARHEEIEHDLYGNLSTSTAALVFAYRVGAAARY